MRNAMRRAPTLTVREKDIIRLLFDGYSNREMAESLGLSALTIRNHVSNLLLKFQVRNRTELLSRFVALRRRYHRRLIP